MALDKVVDSAALDAGMTAVADVIRAKAGTTEPLAWPDGFKAAIEAISGGSGNAVQIGQESPTPNFMNLFYALEQGTAATGTFTLASPLSGETLIFSSGLSALNGILLVNTDRTEYAAGGNEGVFIGFGLLSESELILGFMLNTASNSNPIKTDFIVRGTWRVDGGDLYATPNYNNNQNYTPFRPGETYRWVAW